MLLEGEKSDGREIIEKDILWLGKELCYDENWRDRKNDKIIPELL